jgi:hypothetical protein
MDKKYFPSFLNFIFFQGGGGEKEQEEQEEEEEQVLQCDQPPVKPYLKVRVKTLIHGQGQVFRRRRRGNRSFSVISLRSSLTSRSGSVL